MGSATNVYVYNDQRLMTNFTEKLTRVGRSIVDGISSRYETIDQIDSRR